MAEATNNDNDSVEKTLSIMIHGPSKAGKALYIDTPILTETGWKTMGTVAVGDRVHTEDGTLTEVEAVTEVMYDHECVRVTTKSGRSLICDIDHQWEVLNPRGQRSTRTTRQLMMMGITQGIKKRVFKHRIPLALPIERSDSALPIDPYVLGVWLGDGSSSNGQFGVNQHSFSEIEAAFHSAGYEIGTRRSVRGAVIFTAFGLVTDLKKCGLLNNKHVPDQYFLASQKQRARLLQGLLDTDGSATTRSSGLGRVRFVNTNKSLIDAVSFLAQSLGLQTYVHEQPKTHSWVVAITASQADGLFSVRRKQNKLPKRISPQVDAIVDMEIVDTVPVRCIQVAHPSGTYLAGSDLLVTHNSTVAATAPAPRLLLDAEHGHRFLNVKIKYWDPASEAPPEPDGTWDTCVVVVRNYDTVLQVYRWMQSGQHPFKSLILDSISEIQTQCLEQLTGREQVKMQQWGELLRHMTGLMRDLRDLTMHPTHPLNAVVLTAMTVHKDDKWRPYLQGASATSAPYFFDITGYLQAEEYPNPDPSKPPYTARRLYVGPSIEYVSGERVGGRLGNIVEQDDLNIEKMIDRIYGTE